MTLGERQCEFTHNLALLIIHAANKGLSVKIQEVNRTMDQQKHNVAIGVSWTLDSRHLVNLAADLYIYDHSTHAPVEDLKLYEQLGVYWESTGGVWGGRWLDKQGKPKDVYHFELPWPLK